MKRILVLLTVMAISMTASASDTARLALWIKDQIGVSDGTRCYQSGGAAAGIPPLPSTPPTLTDHDIRAWKPDEGRWTLNPPRFPGTVAAERLLDRCFVLAIDGRVVSTGVVLSGHSARLTGFPTIIISSRNNVLDMQLLSSNHGPHQRLIHIDALEDALHHKPSPTK